MMRIEVEVSKLVVDGRPDRALLSEHGGQETKNTTP